MLMVTEYGRYNELACCRWSFYNFNGNCSDWSCKEDISGLPCADPGNYNDRSNLLGGFTQDTTLYLQYGDCSTPSGNTGIVDNTKDVIQFILTLHRM